MATVFQRSDGSWTATVRKKPYRSISKSFPTEKQAESWGSDIEASMRLGLFKHPKDIEAEEKQRRRVDPTFTETLDRYVEMEAKDAKGWMKAKGRVDALRVSKIAALPLSEIGGLEINNLISGWKRKGLAPATIHRYLAVVSKAFRWGISDGAVVRNPVRELIKPKVKNERNRRLEEGEEAAIVAACKRVRFPFMRQMVILALETSWRSQELRGIQWGNIDFAKGNLYLPKERSKNGMERNTPLSAKAIEALQSLPRGVGRANIWCREIAADQLAHWWRTVTRNAKMDDHHFHDLRHEAVSRLVERGFRDLEIMVYFSGHETLSMLKRYSHLRNRPAVQARLARENTAEIQQRLATS